MKILLFRFLCCFKVHGIIRFLCRKKIIILMYHGFTGMNIHNGIENHLGYHINIEIFVEQILYLKKYYNIISLERLVEYYYSGAKLPNNSVVITFDDGYKSNYNLAFPILKELNIPATIFLTTDFIENKNFLWVDRLEYAINYTALDKLKIEINKKNFLFRIDNYKNKILCIQKIKQILKKLPRDVIEEKIGGIENYINKKLATSQDVPDIYMPLGWDEIKKMTSSGIISIGSHTHRHAILTRCSSQEVKKELFLSKKLIKEKDNQNCQLFCYPNGQIGDFDHRTRKLLQDQGYICGLTTVAGMNTAHADIFALKRFYSSNDKDLAVFIMIISGVSRVLNNLRKIINKLTINCNTT